MGELYGETINIDSPAFGRLRDDGKILSQALRMRFGTERGFLWDSPDYGLAFENYLEDGVTAEKLAALSSEMKAECESDVRVSSAAVFPGLTITEDGAELRPEIKVFPKTGEPIPLVLPVSKLSGPALRAQREE